MKLRKIITIIITITFVMQPIHITEAVEKTDIDRGIEKTYYGSSIPVQVNARLEGSILNRYSKYQSVSVAARNVKRDMLNHKANITTYIKTKSSDPVKVFNKLEQQVFAITDKGDEGDYLFWDIDQQSPRYSQTASKVGKTTYYYYRYDIGMWYLTTLEQKRQVDAKVKEIISGFCFTESTTEYEKVKTIYDYVCNNVVYSQDLNSDIVYTSWSALFRGEAVCQGYAQLLYRMFKEVGIETRVIPGYGEGTMDMHGWNIVRLGDYFYHLDATWDSELLRDEGAYRYFLKGDNFAGHIRLSEYNTLEFYCEYPMAAQQYTLGTISTLSKNSLKAIFCMVKPKFRKISSKKIKLKKVSDADGYQIAYFYDKKSKKEIKYKKIKKTVYKISKFKNKRKKHFYVKFRAYKTIGKEKFYTKWSKTKKIKIK